MIDAMCDEMLDIVRRPAMTRLHDLMQRLKLNTLTPLEVLAILAVLESADQRVNAPTAPVLRLAGARSERANQ